ncbi:MAG TPA: hypothetical protein PKY59_17025 [Pyrinomonadaceae bacterium]|nr:hypothetical protein [Pyrinomonadaceae bacterium]
MNTKQIKKFLIDNDLTIAEMARQLSAEERASESSLQQMLSDMFYQRRWYPSLAETVNKKFGLNLIRPKQFEPKVRLKQAA